MAVIPSSFYNDIGTIKISPVFVEDSKEEKHRRGRIRKGTRRKGERKKNKKKEKKKEKTQNRR
jgi:hypothetical protein